MENEIRISQEAVKNPDKYTDPVEFMSRFRSSGFYHTAYDAFFEGKNVSPQATQESKEIAFLQNSRGTDAMLEYYLDEGNFTYNPEAFPECSRAALEKYIDFVKSTLVNPTRDDIQERDTRRSSLHISAGNALVKDGIVPTVRAGRMLARIALVDLKIETPEQAQAMR